MTVDFGPCNFEKAAPEASGGAPESILVVDDELTIRRLAREALELLGFAVLEAEDVPNARAKLSNHTDIALVITDIIMPQETGIDLLVWAHHHQPELPVIVMTAFTEVDFVIDALNNGAHSFIKKPFTIEEFHKIVKNALAKRRYEQMKVEFQEHLSRTNSMLRQKCIDAVVEHEQLFLGALSALAQTIDARDPYTRQHSASVASLARRLAAHIGLSANEQNAVELAGSLHDLGKIGVPESILLKPERLTEEEYEVMKGHPVAAATILEPVPGLENSLPAIRAHHEHYNGGGYPDGQAGESIPLLARILGVCDTWDAMTSDRPYRKALSAAAAGEILRQVQGEQLDPELVAPFLELVDSGEVQASQAKAVATAQSGRFSN